MGAMIPLCQFTEHGRKCMFAGTDRVDGKGHEYDLALYCSVHAAKIRTDAIVRESIRLAKCLNKESRKRLRG